MSVPDQNSKATNPIGLAIGIAIGTVALIFGIVLMVQLAIGSYGARSLKDEPAMSAEAVAKRIAPVARLVIDPNAPPPAAVAAPAAAIAVVAVAADAGKATYESICAACHAAGVANAPKPGDKAAWAPRIKTGKEAMYASVIKGKGAMPPKGGNPALSDDAVKAAVDYLVSTAK